MSITTITFDAGGTLLEPWPSVGHVYAEVLAECGCPGLDPDLLTRNFLAAWRAKKDFDYSKGGWAELVEATFHGLSGAPEPAVYFPALYDRFTWPKAWKVYEDARPALQALQEQGLQLGVISNWDERLHPLLERLGLSPYFRLIQASGDLGRHKPDPVIFHTVLNKLGAAPEECLHVGDSWREDVEGAQGAGMSGVLIDRSGRKPAGSAIASLLELADLAKRRVF